MSHFRLLLKSNIPLSLLIKSLVFYTDMNKILFSGWPVWPLNYPSPNQGGFWRLKGKPIVNVSETPVFIIG